MKKLLLALLFASCCVPDKTPVVQARIVFVAPAINTFNPTPSRTYVINQHGHNGSVHGIRGLVGESISVRCNDGFIY